MIDFNCELSVQRQASILNVPRSSLYYKPVINDASQIANLIREIYLTSDCRYGYRKITASLHQKGIIVNNKKTLRTSHVKHFSNRFKIILEKAN